MASLAAADLVYCSLALPATAVMLEIPHFSHVDVICRLYAFFFTWNFSVILLNHAAVAFSRYVTVCLPPDSVFQSKSYLSSIIIASAWITNW